MKRHLNIIASTVLLTGFLVVSSAQAQTNSDLHLTATIPFEFSVKDQSWPAGEYKVSCINPSSPNKILRLSRKDGSTALILQTSTIIGRIKDEARLVFRRYGDKHFLAQVWLPADSAGLAIQKSRSEKEIARRPASMQVSTATVALHSARR